MSFISARARLTDAIFRRLGEDGTWAGVATPVRIILREQDDDIEMGNRPIIGSAKFVRVRRSDVAAPAIDDLVLPLETGGAYVVIAEPTMDRRGVWRCEVAEGGD